eukprot:scaffold1046_cov172-Amphora_coffeaeformis.AAC.6
MPRRTLESPSDARATREDIFVNKSREKRYYEGMNLMNNDAFTTNSANAEGFSLSSRRHPDADRSGIDDDG